MGPDVTTIPVGGSGPPPGYDVGERCRRIRLLSPNAKLFGVVPFGCLKRSQERDLRISRVGRSTVPLAVSVAVGRPRSSSRSSW